MTLEIYQTVLSLFRSYDYLFGITNDFTRVEITNEIIFQMDVNTLVDIDK